MLNPGPELDALVAEKVMGWVHYDSGKDDWWTDHAGNKIEPISDWEPSVDIVAAWDVIKQLGRLDFRIRISIDFDGDCDEIVLEAGDCNCPHQKPYDAFDGHGWTLIEHIAESVQKVPHAICLAALKAKGVEIE